MNQDQQAVLGKDALGCHKKENTPKLISVFLKVLFIAMCLSKTIIFYLILWLVSTFLPNSKRKYCFCFHLFAENWNRTKLVKHNKKQCLQYCNERVLHIHVKTTQHYCSYMYFGTSSKTNIWCSRPIFSCVYTFRLSRCCWVTLSFLRFVSVEFQQTLDWPQYTQIKTKNGIFLTSVWFHC